VIIYSFGDVEIDRVFPCYLGMYSACILYSCQGMKLIGLVVSAGGPLIAELEKGRDRHSITLVAYLVGPRVLEELHE
jgi:hypothetical protein